MSHKGDRQRQKANWFARRVAYYRRKGYSFKQAVRMAKKWGATASFKQKYSWAR